MANVRCDREFDTSTFTYDGKGRLLRVVDPAGELTVQSYTGFGEPKHKTQTASSAQQSAWRYDELGRKTQYKMGGRVDLGYRYDESTGRLTEIVRGAPSDSKAPVLLAYRGYDGLGRVTSATRLNVHPRALSSAPDRPVKTTLLYDDVNRRYSETTQVGQRIARTVTSKWDLSVGGKWIRQLTLPGGRGSVDTYDGDWRPVELHRQNGGVTSFTWLNELMTNIASTKPGTALGRAVQFDGLGQPTKWDFTHQSTGPSALHVDVRRDNMGRIASSTMAMASGETSWRGYAYDAMGRLSVVRESRFAPDELPEAHQTTHVMGEQVEASADAVSAQRWAYEREAKVGSVVTISRTDVTLTAPRFSASARAAGHQLQSYDMDGSGQRAVTHDGAGRLTNDGTQRFVFDDMGALVETRELGTDAVKEAYLYDVSGRLVSRSDASGDSELLVYDGIQMVQAWDSKEDLCWAASWGPGVDRLLSVEKQGTEYFALDDGRGSVVGWLDPRSNTVAARADYTPEGRGKYVNEAAGTTCTESGNTRCRNPLGLPFGFHSAFVAKESGLLYFRNRWYSTEANQWLSQDPLDFVDSFDLYAFNAFDAVNHRDPMGLSVGAVTCGAGTAGCGFDEEEVKGERAEPGAAAPEPARPEFEFSFTEMEYQLDVAGEYAVGPAMDRHNDKLSSRDVSSRDVSSGGASAAGRTPPTSRPPSRAPRAKAPPQVFKVDSQLMDAPNIAKALKMAEAGIRKLPESIDLQFRTKNYVKDREGRTRIKEEQFTLNFDLGLGGGKIAVAHVPALAKDGLGETPPLATAQMIIATHWLPTLSTEEVARTFVHEWAHNMINRNLQLQTNPSAAYEVMSRDTVSIEFLDPTSNKWTPVFGPEQTIHEAGAQHVSSMFSSSVGIVPYK